MRNRLIAFLLLPVLSLIFIIGWFMYFTGDKNENSRKSPIVINQTIAKTRKKQNIEFGLVEDLAKEDQVKQQ